MPYGRWIICAPKPPGANLGCNANEGCDRGTQYGILYHSDRSGPVPCLVCGKTSPQPFMTAPSLRTSCCIVGGGPAGMMLGIAAGPGRSCGDGAGKAPTSCVISAAIRCILHWKSFMSELGLLNDFLLRPHQKVSHPGSGRRGHTVTVAEFEGG